MKVQFFNYYLLFQKYYSGSLFVLLAVVFAVGLLEVFGILMFIPLFESFDAQQTPQNNAIRDTLSLVFTFFSIPTGLVPISLLVVLLLSIKGVMVLLSYRWIASARATIIANLRTILFRKLLSEKRGSLVEESVGESVNLLNEQATRSLNSFTFFANAVMNLVLAGTFITVGIFLAPMLALVLLLSISVFLVLFKALNQRVKRISLSVGRETSVLSQYIIESFRALKYIRISKTDPYFEERATAKIQELANWQRLQGNAKAVSHAAKEPFTALIVTGIFIFQFYATEGRLAETLVVLVVFYRAMASSAAFQSTWQSMLENIGGIELIDGYLEADQGGDNATPLRSIVVKRIVTDGGSVDVGERRIPCPQMDVSVGDMTMITGRSGSGKSTFLNHAVGLVHGPSLTFKWGDLGNALRIGDVCDINFGYLGPDCELFSGSVLSNITFKSCLSDVDETRLSDALDIAQCREFLPDSESLSQAVQHNGANFSSGQGQRILLARELYRVRRGFLFLDEATSALDSGTEREIFGALKAGGYYGIININHRRDNIDLFDSVINFT